ncbi:MAG TPA: hypothetical protein PK113_04670, partial [Bacillota bacterium]|nr:hypothetical protein [Bacillota bacterium]
IKKIDLVYSVILALVVLSGVIILVVNYLSNTSAGVIDAAQFYFDSEAVMKMLGTISGFIMAIKYEHRMVNFENHHRLAHNLIRFALGIAVILAVRYGLKYIFTLIVDSDQLASGQGLASIIALLLDYTRYLLILFVGIGVYPRLFKILNI